MTFLTHRQHKYVQNMFRMCFFRLSFAYFNPFSASTRTFFNKRNVFVLELKVLYHDSSVFCKIIARVSNSFDHNKTPCRCVIKIDTVCLAICVLGRAVNGLNMLVNLIISFYKWEGRVHAGNTTYTADSHPNSTKPRQENNMNVNG